MGGWAVEVEHPIAGSFSSGGNTIRCDTPSSRQNGEGHGDDHMRAHLDRSVGGYHADAVGIGLHRDDFGIQPNVESGRAGSQPITQRIDGLPEGVGFHPRVLLYLDALEASVLGPVIAESTCVASPGSRTMPSTTQEMPAISLTAPSCVTPRVSAPSSRGIRQGLGEAA